MLGSGSHWGVHLQKVGYQSCPQGSFTRKSQTTSKRSKISPKVPFTEYICDRPGENIDGVNCSEYCLLQDYKQKHASNPNISKEEREAIKILKDDTQVVLTADKGVAMVVMNKSSGGSVFPIILFLHHWYRFPVLINQSS